MFCSFALFRQRVRPAAFWAAAVLVLLGGEVRAENGRWTFSLDETGVWDSNPLMRATDVEAAYGLLTVPRLAYIKETPRTGLGFTTRVANSVYDETDLNSTDVHLTAHAARRTQRAEVALRLLGDYDTTRTAETTTFGTETRSTRRVSYGGAPSFSYALSPVSRLQTSANYQNVRYDDDGADHTDYHVMSASGRYVGRLTPHFDGFGGVQLRRYETQEGTRRQVDSGGPNVGLIARLSPIWTGEVSVGAQTSRETLGGLVVSDWSWSGIMSASMEYKGEQVGATFTLSRSQQSYSNGTDRLLTGGEVEGSYRISPLWRLTAGLDYAQADAEDSAGRQLDQRYGGRVGTSYRVTRDVSLSASYGYRCETFTQGARKAERDLFRIGLSYSPKTGDGR